MSKKEKRGGKKDTQTQYNEGYKNKKNSKKK